MAGQRGVIHSFIAPDFLAHISPSDRDSLVEVNRVFERLEDDIGRARETVIGSFELYASRVAQDTNQLLKVLTIATLITGAEGGNRLTEGATLRTGGEVKRARFAALEFGGSGGTGG